MKASEKYEHARQRYRQTSRNAWASVQHFLPSIDGEIVETIVSEGRATSERVEQLTGLKHQTVSAQISHMSRAGLLQDSGGRSKTLSGRAAIQWEVAV